MAKKKEKEKEPKFPKANTVQLGSRPPHARVMWVGITIKDDNSRTVHNGSTVEGLQKALSKNDMDEFMIIDLKLVKMSKIPLKSVDRFLEMWTKNYFNKKWGYKHWDSLFD